MKDEKLVRVLAELKAGIGPADDVPVAEALAKERGLDPDGGSAAAPVVVQTDRMFSAASLAPMTCDSVERVSEVKGDPADLLMNPKIDGYRLVCVVEDGKVTMMSRGLKYQDGKLPYLESELLRIFPPGTVLDGEICALVQGEDKKVVNDFEHVQSIMNSDAAKAVRKAEFTRPLTYHCFDMLAYEGVDLKAKPLKQRVAMLHREVGEQSEVFQLTPYVPATQEHHDAWVEAGFEGTVVKHRESTYHVGDRGHGWTKLKHKHEMDVIIVGFLPGQGKFEGMVGATVFAQPTDDPEMQDLSGQYVRALEKSAVKRGSTLVLDRDLMERLGLAVRGACSGYTDLERSDLEGSIGTVISVHHNGLMAKGLKVRHPQFFRDRRDEKVAEEIGWHHR